ncbi:MAG TPA: glycoside hydrolase family 3 N-terminal domain-containing protein [Anaerolineales bacterium]|nr:glycoside hydrolase family 3 N-terminal domain-containing protein [Anaerolineales bacterium]
MLRRAFLLVLILNLSASAASAGPSIDRSISATAQSILADMTPEERVGQLFLVTFTGQMKAGDPALELVTRHYVAGVILRADNDNFTDPPGTLANAAALIARLQAARHAISESAATPVPGELGGGPVYIPLIIGLSLDRDGKYGPEILGGLSELPTEMAVGATWSPVIARRVGETVGSELSALGVNLLLGPSLDVIEEAQAGRSGDPGVSAFGGDPYWVGVLGRAFISGVHAGSDGALAVVAKHFPGLGAADRPVTEEVPTVRKSLDEIQQVDLAPFFAVTGGLPGDSPEVADGLLTSHIRYQGLQGNIRATTRPVSLDGQALGQILSLQTLPTWRQGGGVMISDSLGSRALRRFYDPSEQTFNGTLVTKDAFLAGNDLLILENFQSSGDDDEVESMVEAISAFVTRYRDDPAFGERVDASVLRVLELKLRLFGGGFPRDGVASGDVEKITGGSQLAFSVASQAASLISPAGTEPPGPPPSAGQRIVFFTDVRVAAQCGSCSQRLWMDPRGLETAVLELYGPGVAGEVGGWNLLSFTMADLALALGERPPSSTPKPLAPTEEVLRALDAADWLVFSILSTRDGEFGSNALKLLLDQRPDLARQRRVVVFAHDVPYELDATDISKLDAYYALYGASESFVSLAARLLFQEVAPSGDPPVAVPGVGYDLIAALSPDPDQKISLRAYSEVTGSVRVTPEAGYSVGDHVYMETSPIVDHNGRTVPDGTPVEFLISYQGENLSPVIQSVTTHGVAQTSIELDRIGQISVQARSDPARVSDILLLDVREGTPAFITVIAPSPMPTATVAATRTAEGALATPEPGSAGAGRGGGSGAPLGLSGFVVAILMTSGVVAASVRAGKVLDPRPMGPVRYGLLAGIGALAAYDYVALGFPGTAIFRVDGGLWWLAGLMLVGGALGVGAARGWQQGRFPGG